MGWKLDKTKNRSERTGAASCLATARAGSSVLIERVHGDDAFRGRMSSLGIIKGARVTVLQSGKGTPVLAALAGSRFMLDPASAALIHVCPTEVATCGRRV